MASKHSDFATRTHDAIHTMVAPYHEQLHRIAQVEHKCKLQRAVLKATAMAELGQQAAGLKLSTEAVNRVSLFCW